MLRLKANRPLAPATVKGIAGLVVGQRRVAAARVGDDPRHLRPLPVAPVGRMAGAGGAAQFERQQQIERDLATRVDRAARAGRRRGRVRVNVVGHPATPTSIEETEERFDPASVVRSRQTSSRDAGARQLAPAASPARARISRRRSSTSTRGDGRTAADAPHPRPPAAAAPPRRRGAIDAGRRRHARAHGPGRTSETTNYEVSRTTRHTVTGRRPGLARLSVAVILDDERVPTKARRRHRRAPTTTSPGIAAEIQRLHGLVSAAVGLDTKRGDQLTVENIVVRRAGRSNPSRRRPASACRSWTARSSTGRPRCAASAILLLALFALFGILRPLAQRATARDAAPALPAPAGRRGPAADRLGDGRADRR